MSLLLSNKTYDYVRNHFVAEQSLEATPLKSNARYKRIDRKYFDDSFAGLKNVYIHKIK